MTLIPKNKYSTQISKYNKCKTHKNIFQITMKTTQQHQIVYHNACTAAVNVAYISAQYFQYVVWDAVSTSYKLPQVLHTSKYIIAGLV